MQRLAQRSSIEHADTIPYVRAATGPRDAEHHYRSGNEDRAEQTATGGQPGPVLVVDDDRAILSTITEILDLEGYPFSTASDGAEALRQIAAVRPTLVLLDMRMPVLNGWEVARTLRERGIMVPIVVMTAARDARLWSEQIGAAGYLAKPFDLDDLLATVARFFPD